jgi:peroxiredoxin
MKRHIGSMAPGFTAKDAEDRDIFLSGLLQEGPVVLVLLRGFS